MDATRPTASPEMRFRGVPSAQLALQVPIDHVVQQRALSGAGYARDGRERAERYVHVHAAEVVQLGAAHLEPHRSGGPARARHRDPLLPCQILPRERVRRRRDRSGVHHATASITGARPQLQHEVGLLYRREVVLDDDDRVAAVAQAAEQREQAVGISGMQPDGRLVQDVQGVHQLGAERIGEGDPLRLAPGERSRLPVEREVAQTHVAQKAEPGVELVHDEMAHLTLERRQLQRAEPLVNEVHGTPGHSRDGLAADPYRQRIGVEAAAAAVAAGLGELVLPQEHADVLLVSLLLEVLEEGEDPDVLPLAAIEQVPSLARLELVPRLRRVGADAPRELLQQPAPGLVARLGPGIDGAFHQAAIGIRHHERLVVFQHGAESVARRAGAPRIVEGEERRGDGRRGRVAGAAGGRPGEAKPPAIVQGEGDPFTLLEGGGDRFRDPAERIRRSGQPIHHDEQLARPGEIEAGGQLFEVMGDAIGHHAHEAERAEVLDHRRVRQPGDGRQRKRDLQPAEPGGHDIVGGGLGRVHADGGPARAAEAASDASPEEAQVVVDLGCRPDGGPARHHRIALLDRHRRRDAFEPVHQRLGHAVEELLGVGRERLDVPPLALGVERIEGERALPRARGTGNHRERAMRQIDGDALQVVLASVDDADDGIGHERNVREREVSG